MATPTDTKPSPRERLLAAADALFYAEGVHTVGIDRVIARAGVAKATLYSAFGSKDGLNRTYRDRRRAPRRAPRALRRAAGGGRGGEPRPPRRATRAAARRRDRRRAHGPRSARRRIGARDGGDPDRLRDRGTAAQVSASGGHQPFRL